MAVLDWVKNKGEDLLDIVYQRFCAGCSMSVDIAGRGYLCSRCLASINSMRPPFCSLCGCEVDALSDRLCGECAGAGYFFSHGYTACRYEGLIKDCIHSFKYRSYSYLGWTLAYILSSFVKKYVDVSWIDIIVPVPLHWERMRGRGFNQADVLARHLGRSINIPVLGNAVSRRRTPRHQVELNRRERIRNVRGIFSAGKPGIFLGRHILLIDDVFTTGATLSECARALLGAGAADVWALTLARNTPGFS